MISLDHSPARRRPISAVILHLVVFSRQGQAEVDVPHPTAMDTIDILGLLLHASPDQKIGRQVAKSGVMFALSRNSGECFVGLE